MLRICNVMGLQNGTLGSRYINYIYIYIYTYTYYVSSLSSISLVTYFRIKTIIIISLTLIMARQAMEMEFSVQLYEFPVHGLLDEVQRHLAKLKSVAGALFMDIKLKLTLTHPQKVQY